MSINIRPYLEHFIQACTTQETKECEYFNLLNALRNATSFKCSKDGCERCADWSNNWSKYVDVISRKEIAELLSTCAPICRYSFCPYKKFGPHNLDNHDQKVCVNCKFGMHFNHFKSEHQKDEPIECEITAPRKAVLPSLLVDRKMKLLPEVVPPPPPPMAVGREQHRPVEFELPKTEEGLEALIAQLTKESLTTAVSAPRATTIRGRLREARSSLRLLHDAALLQEKTE
jgi:hypothetical protein